MTQNHLTKSSLALLSSFLLISIAEKTSAAPCTSVNGTTETISVSCESLTVLGSGTATINSGVTITNGGTNRAVALQPATLLTNNGTISGDTYGILVHTGVTNTITNLGVIRDGYDGLSGIYVGFGGSLTNLNNAQGGNGATQATTALTYQRVLPNNYSVIVLSSSHYGQLAVHNSLDAPTPPSGTITFGIHNSSVVSRGTYASVLSGITLSNINNIAGNYNGFTWRLNNSSGTLWDLIVTGASTVDTQQSLVNTASALRNTYALQNTVLVNGFSYDCPIFDKNGICLSTGGRYSTTNANSVSTTSALLIGAYRLSKQIRLGAYVDQNLSNSGNTVNLSNSKPMIGLFGVWNEREDGIGTEVKVSAGYGTKDTTITRQSVGTSETGGGGSTLKTTGAEITAKYNMAMVDRTIVSPYVGIRYTQNRMNSYVEATNSNVTAPLTYSALNTDAVTAIAGVSMKYQLDSALALLASASLESDLSNNHGTYSATGITGLTAINFNANSAKTRATFSAGAHYDIDKRQRIYLTGIYRQEAYRSVNTTAVFATYMVGL